MILFLPINGPLLRMTLNAFNVSFPFGDFLFFTLCIIMFIVGGVMTFTPKLKFESMSKSP